MRIRGVRGNNAAFRGTRLALQRAMWITRPHTFAHISPHKRRDAAEALHLRDVGQLVEQQARIVPAI